MDKNNEEEKSLVPVKKKKRHLRKSIKKILIVLGLGVSSLFGLNKYQEIQQRDIKEIEEIANDKELLNEYNLKKEDIKKYMECEKKFQEIDKMSYEEVHKLLHETSEIELNIHKEKIVNMFKKMSNKDKIRLAQEFEKTTDIDKIKEMYNIDNKEDIEIVLGVYGGKDNITVYNKDGEILCKYTEESYAPKEKTEFGKACNALGRIQYYDKNFNENDYKDIEKALDKSFEETNEIIKKEYILEDGKIETTEPKKEDKKAAFSERYNIDLGNGYIAKINNEKEKSDEIKDIKNIDDIEQDL